MAVVGLLLAVTVVVVTHVVVAQRVGRHLPADLPAPDRRRVLQLCAVPIFGPIVVLRRERLPMSAAVLSAAVTLAALLLIVVCLPRSGAPRPDPAVVLDSEPGPAPSPATAAAAPTPNVPTFSAPQPVAPQPAAPTGPVEVMPESAGLAHGVLNVSANADATLEVPFTLDNQSYTFFAAASVTTPPERMVERGGKWVKAPTDSTRQLYFGGGIRDYAHQLVDRFAPRKITGAEACENRVLTVKSQRGAHTVQLRLSHVQKDPAGGVTAVDIDVNVR